MIYDINEMYNMIIKLSINIIFEIFDTYILLFEDKRC